MSDIREITVRSRLDNSGFSTGLGKMRADARRVSEELGKGMFGRDSMGAFKSGLVGAGVALAGWQAGLRVVNAVWDRINENAKRYTELMSQGRSGEAAQFRDQAGMSAMVESGTSKITSWLAKAASLALKTSLFGKNFDPGAAADAQSAVANRDEVRKQLAAYEQQKRDDKLEASRLREDNDFERGQRVEGSSADKVYNLEREIQRLRNQLAEHENAKTEAELIKKERELESVKEQIAKAKTQAEDQLAQQRIAREQDPVRKAALLDDAIRTAQSRQDALYHPFSTESSDPAESARLQAQIEEMRSERALLATDLSKKIGDEKAKVTANTVAGGLLSSGFSLKGAQVFSSNIQSQQLSVLQRQYDMLQRIEANTKSPAGLYVQP